MGRHYRLAVRWRASIVLQDHKSVMAGPRLLNKGALHIHVSFIDRLLGTLVLSSCVVRAPILVVCIFMQAGEYAGCGY